MDVVTYALAQKYVKNAIGSLDAVTDVTVDGNSVVNADGVAEIVTPQILGEVADVKVDGQSVVDSEGVAQITLPDSANAISYDNSESGLDSTNIQDAVDEVLDKANKVDDIQTYGGNTLVTNKIADLSALTMKKSIPSTPTAIATFDDGAEMVMPSLKVGVEAVQDLHGYDSPWVGGAGKNKYNKDGKDTDNGYISGRYLKSDGDYAFNNAWEISEYIPVEANTQYTLSGVSGYSPSIVFYDSNKEFLGGESYRDVLLKTYTTPTNTAYVRISVFVETSNVTQFELGSTATSFAPYSNICPIIGWDEVDLTVADDVNNPTVSNVYTIDLNGTRYGGRLEVVNGVAQFVANKGYIASYNGETLPSDWISDRDVYSEGANPTIGAEVVYTLSTPTIIPLGNYPISSLVGENNLFADSGEILEGEYIADASAVIAGLDARITALENA